ncbi:MAG: CDGSH iron-sulfur domain-containing protein [Pseudomonadota bacterium]
MSEETDQSPIIDMREDGPLLGKHLGSITLADGTVEELKPLAPLCRCGASSNKPYCDGSHRDIEYKSENRADETKDKLRAYTGENVTVFYNKLLCSHAGECVRRAGAVFNTKERPWIKPDAGDRASIMDAVAHCPSGALQVAELSTDDASEARHIKTDQVSLKIEKDGPYHVANLPTTAQMTAAGQTEAKYVLCRCGLSTNAPFCDGSHVDKNWSDGG